MTMATISIPGSTDDVSDGYHTFGELYKHRVALFIALMKAHPDISWIAKEHHDGTGIEGWYIAGMSLPTGDITYHLPFMSWMTAKRIGCAVLDRAPQWDGHTSEDVYKRLEAWVCDFKLEEWGESK